MGDRWVTLGGALSALLLVALLFYQPSPRDIAPRPTTLESQPNGYRALHDWYSAGGLEVRSVRHRLEDYFADAEATAMQPATGNVMFTVMPHAKPQRHSDHRALRSWVRAGNTLVMLVALNDTPAWQFNQYGFVEGDVEHLVDVRFDARVDADGDELTTELLQEPRARRFAPLPVHPLMEGVDELRVESDALASEWVADFSGSAEHPLQLARDIESGDAVLWELSYGDGRVLLSSVAGLFSNRMLAFAGNAQLAGNIAAWHLGPNGTILFDDYHQGVSELYDPEAFFSDSRLHTTGLFLVVLWLFYLLGSSARLGPLREPATQTGQAALVRATAGLMSHKLSEAESGRAMINAWLGQLRAGGRLPPSVSGDPPWDLLLDMPLVDTAIVADLRRQYVAMGQGSKVDLVRLHNNIQTLKGNLG